MTNPSFVSPFRSRASPQTFMLSSLITLPRMSTEVSAMLSARQRPMARTPRALSEQSRSSRSARYACALMSSGFTQWHSVALSGTQWHSQRHSVLIEDFIASLNSAALTLTRSPWPIAEAPSSPMRLPEIARRKSVVLSASVAASAAAPLGPISHDLSEREIRARQPRSPALSTAPPSSPSGLRSKTRRCGGHQDGARSEFPN